MNMRKGSLGKSAIENAWLMARRNSRMCSHLGSLITAFFARSWNAISDDEKWRGGREGLRGAAKTVIPIGKIARVISMNVESIMGALVDVIAGDVSVSAKEAKTEEDLKKLQWLMDVLESYAYPTQVATR